MINNIKEKAREKQMEHLPFVFPLSVNADGTRIVTKFDTVTQNVQFSRDGMNLLLQKYDRYEQTEDGPELVRFVDRSKARGLYRSSLRDFVGYLNTCYENMCVFDPTLRDRVYWTATNQNVVYGVMSYYNPKLNTEVLDDIVNHNLEANIKRWYVTYTQMVVYLDYKSQDGFEIGLAVCNGETGHTALSYRLYVHDGDYTFETPTFGRRKHLSNLELVEQDLTKAYEELSELKFYDYIMNTPAYTYATMLLDDPKFEKIHDLAAQYDSRIRKVYQLLSKLSEQRRVRGYKTICTQALDKLYKEILNHA